MDFWLVFYTIHFLWCDEYLMAPTPPFWLTDRSGNFHSARLDSEFLQTYKYKEKKLKIQRIIFDNLNKQAPLIKT
jgi:hypothetical protein